jgi:peptidoglycan/xylan/chitin deacetylase (PgdA/CDA1 family)
MAPLSIAFYHRVADSYPNNWTISRRQFRRHVEYCLRKLEIVSLTELQRRIVLRDSPRPSISFTFDDGYRDNCEYAIPLMLEHEIPCVYFVALDHIVQQRPFAHDIKAGRPLPVNSLQDLRDMAQCGIEIGLHTRTHVDFARVHSSDVVRAEIIEAKEELEQAVGQQVRYFAFPYGLPEQLTQAAIEVVHEAGMSAFCSAYGGYNLPGGDAFHLRRFHGESDFSRFHNWVSFDHGKVQREPRVRYFLPPTRCYDETFQILERELAECH